jgi:hypothetical protein
MTDDLYQTADDQRRGRDALPLAKAACPQQQFDQYTPDMWHELLGDLRFEDAQDALVSVVKAQPFVSPAEIRDQVKKVRRQRLLDFGYVVPPAELASNPEAEGRWIYETNQAIADGRLKKGDKPERPQELLARVMPDWDKVLPSPEPVRRAQITAEKRRAKPTGPTTRRRRARPTHRGAAEVAGATRGRGGCCDERGGQVMEPVSEVEQTFRDAMAHPVGTVGLVEGRTAVLIGRSGGPRRWQWLNGDWTAIPLGAVKVLGHLDAGPGAGGDRG